MNLIWKLRKNKIYRIFFWGVKMVLLIIALVIAFILLSNIKFTLYVNHNKDVDANIILFRVIKININDKNRIRTQKKVKHKIDIQPNLAVKLFKKMKPHIKYLLSKTKIKIKLDIIFGLFSPDKTAITYGIVNSIIYTFDNVLRSKTKRFDSIYNITPDFNKSIFDTSLELEIYARVFNLLVFTFKALIILFKNRSYFKRKGGVFNGSSNRRINENYTG